MCPYTHIRVAKIEYINILGVAYILMLGSSPLTTGPDYIRVFFHFVKNTLSTSF